MQTILTDKNFQKEVLENPAPVLVEFGAEWCGACHILAPILEQLTKEFDGQIRIGRVDIETQARIAKEYGVQDPPVLLSFKNGRVVEQIVGVIPKQIIAARLRAWL
ncbi:thioredoxin [candidate division KSB1 bacterium]|nr:thioredoxin [candidate division KSB1 bacterium]